MANFVLGSNPMVILEVLNGAPGLLAKDQAADHVILSGPDTEQDEAENKGRASIKANYLSGQRIFR